MVSIPSVVAGLIPAFSTSCLFHVGPRVLGGGAADKKTGEVVSHGQIKLVLANCVHLLGSKCNY